MKNQILILLFLGLWGAACQMDESNCSMTYSHDIWHSLLQKHVNLAGRVDYRGLKEDKILLEQYLELLKCNHPDDSWSDNKEMAYWINLNNAFAAYQVVQEYPIQSIFDIDNGMVAETRKIEIGSNSYNLNQIVRNQLLSKFNEPRVHFAVNIGAISSPPLWNQAWTENNIQQAYDDRTSAFINNPSYNTLTEYNVELSMLFDWFKDDFGGETRVLPYIQHYSTVTINDGASIQFKVYNWNLNEQ